MKRKLRRSVDQEFEVLKAAITKAHEEGRAEGYDQGRDEILSAAQVATEELQKDHERAMRELRERAVKEKNRALEAKECQVRQEMGLYSRRTDLNEACLIFLEQKISAAGDDALWKEYQAFVRQQAQKMDVPEPARHSGAVTGRVFHKNSIVLHDGTVMEFKANIPEQEQILFARSIEKFMKEYGGAVRSVGPSSESSNTSTGDDYSDFLRDKQDAAKVRRGR